MDPQNNLVWFNLGNLYEKMHRFDEARLCFRNLSPVKEIASRYSSLGFMIFLVGGAILMIQRAKRHLHLSSSRLRFSAFSG
jgi:hypothetical protein